MAELNLNGKHYEGNKIQVKKDGVYVDGKFQSKIPPPNQSRDSQIDEFAYLIVEAKSARFKEATGYELKDSMKGIYRAKAKAALQKIIDELIISVLEEIYFPSDQNVTEDRLQKRIAELKSSVDPIIQSKSKRSE